MPVLPYHVFAGPWYALFCTQLYHSNVLCTPNTGIITCSTLGPSRAHAYVYMLTRIGHICPASTTELRQKTWGFTPP